MTATLINQLEQNHKSLTRYPKDSSKLFEIGQVVSEKIYEKFTMSATTITDVM